MIKEMIKFDGTSEPFTAEKPTKWGKWAARKLGNRVDWASIVVDAVNECPPVLTTQEFQEKLIDVTLRGESWAHYLMAGKLYAPLIMKKTFGATVPTIRELHLKLAEMGYMYLLDYSEAEYAEMEKVIAHKKDQTYPHFRSEYIYKKYALQNRMGAERNVFETPQFVYMRMAMALAEEQPRERRMQDAVKFYEHLSDGRINAPTPNYVNLGTPLRGFASCCIYSNEDTAASIGIGLHIAYTMTYMSAGCGTHLNTRSLGDAVRGGMIKHQGKLPYIRATKAMVEANLQNGRGGADTLTYSMFDPENETLLQLQNPMSVEEKQIRGIDYSVTVSKFIARFAGKKGKLFKFNSFTAPDLYDAFYSADFPLFEALYDKYEQDPMFVKDYFNARELVLVALTEALETGRYYLTWADEMNRHTPFYDPIFASNLCVAPETLLLTSKGYEQISTLENQPVTVWNGSEWSESVVVKTGVNQKLLKVTTESGPELECTPYHKFYIFDGYGKPYKEVRAHELKVGHKLAKFDLPLIHGAKELDKAYVNGFYSGDGCVTPIGQRVYLYGHEKAVLAPFFEGGGNWTIQENFNRMYKHYNDLEAKYFVPDAQYSVRARLDWLAGYLDADGCVYRNGDNQQLSAVSTELGFLKEVQLMLQTLGLSSKISHHVNAGPQLMPLNDGSGEMGQFMCRDAYRLLINSVGAQQLMMMGLPLRRLAVIPHSPNRDATQFVKIESILDEGRYSDTFCLNEPKRHTVMFNGMLTGQCQEIMLHQRGYAHMMDLYSTEAVGFVKLTTEDNNRIQLAAPDKVYVNRCAPEGAAVGRQGRKVIPAIELQPGEKFSTVPNGLTYQVRSIDEIKYEPEVAMCNIGGVVPANIDSDEQWAEVTYYTLLMIDICIHKAEYELPHIGFTTKARMNAGVGLMGVATWMAKNNYKYSTQEGKDALFHLDETHMYHLITQSIKLGQERGNAEWMHRTRWPEGYLPQDSANQNVLELVTVAPKRDWAPVRQALIDNNGMRFSCVNSHMPGESSSKAAGQPNGRYPVRDVVMTKTDNGIVSRWAAPEGDLWGDRYECAWDIHFTHQIDGYAIGQYWCDQGMSADLWRRLPQGETVGSTELLEGFFRMTKYGLKSRYYYNTLTTEAKVLSNGEIVMIEVRNTDKGPEAPVCGSGGCAM